LASLRSHALNEAQAIARALSAELDSIETARAEARIAIEKDKEHRNEMEFLSVRFKRAATASAVLRDVQFSSCPKTKLVRPRRVGCSNPKGAGRCLLVYHVFIIGTGACSVAL
jgi:cobalamin biosynthesis protein CobT